MWGNKSFKSQSKDLTRFVLANISNTSVTETNDSKKRSKQYLMDSPGLKHKSKVLAIYTGGTIGMKTNDKGGLQKKYFHFNVF